MTLRANAGRALRGADFYPSPPSAAWGLVGVEGRRLGEGFEIWEPACGDGALVRPLRAAGYRVDASDLYDRGCADAMVQDFLTLPPSPLDGGLAIITNPPYALAEAFAVAALERAAYVALLLRIQWLETPGRAALLRRTGLSRVYVFSDRLPMMHREGYEGPKISKGAQAYAWFVWDRSRFGERQVDWIGREDIVRGRDICRGAV